VCRVRISTHHHPTSVLAPDTAGTLRQDCDARAR